MLRKQALLVLGVFIFTTVLSGCTYLRNRKNDALDMFDIGATVSKKPGLALYFDKPLQIIPMGFAHVDGKLIGIGRGRFGVHSYREKGAGYLVGGSLRRGVDNFDQQDPNSPQKYGTGLIGYLNGTTAYQNDPAKDETGPGPKTRPGCALTLHLGWVGFDFTCKPWNMLDFLVGWLGFDIGHDDLPVNSNSKAEAPKPETPKPEPIK